MSPTRRLVRVTAQTRTKFSEAAARETSFHGKAFTHAETFILGKTSIHGESSEPETARASEGLYPEIAGTPCAAFTAPDSALQPTPSPSSSQSSKNAGLKRRRSARRKAAALAKAESSTTAQPVKASTARKHRSFDKVAALLPLEDLPHAAGGSWIGQRGGDGASAGARWRKRVPTLVELMDTGRFQYVPYHPGYVFRSLPLL